MKFESFEEIVNYAIEKENEAAAFYADAAKKEPFSGVKEALEEMANEEKKHAAMLENIGENQEVLENSGDALFRPIETGHEARREGACHV